MTNAVTKVGMANQLNEQVISIIKVGKGEYEYVYHVIKDSNIIQIKLTMMNSIKWLKYCMKLYKGYTHNYLYCWNILIMYLLFIAY